MSLLHDAELTLKVKTALIADERIGAGSINVDTRNGIVTLRGRVPNDALREVAEGIALRHGARQVVNALALAHPDGEGAGVRIPDDFPRVTTPAGAPVIERPSLTEAVAAALVADPRVNEHLIYVQVENGLASLTGRQETVAASEAATEVAAHVPGILGVNNDLEVMPSI
jgi:hyperosmotically inducible periplasmic protein